MDPERLTVRTPEQFLSPPAFEVAMRQLPENPPQRIIQPEDGFCPGPDDIAHHVIIPCDDPFFGLCGLLHSSAKHLQRGGLPVGLPVESIQFDVLQVEAFGESLGKCGFARACHANDDHAFVGECRP